MNLTKLLHKLTDAETASKALNSLIEEFETLSPSCAFYCAGSPLNGTSGLQDKVDFGTIHGTFVDDQVLHEVLSDAELQAADKFPQYCKNNAHPLIWQCDPTRMEERGERRLFGLAADFGVLGGITIPIHQLDNETYGNFTLFFDDHSGHWQDELSQSSTDLHIASLYLHNKLSNMNDSSIHAPVLSPRERDCLALLAQGLQTSQIADRLVLADATVSEYICNARVKLNARTRSEAVARAVQLGCIKL